MCDMCLNELTEKWSKELSDCQYAGELTILEEKLVPLAKLVRNELFSAHNPKKTKLSLFVVAINCMYYSHDEQGFWKHFCDLMDVSNEPASHQWLGSILENQLLHFNFISEVRSGPFRYVSPLKEQCGITRQEIPRFASLLIDLSDKFGWDGIRTLDRFTFNNYVISRFYSGHLLRFLREESGWNFTREVARTISQYQREVIDVTELQNLQGYRTGFFEELFSALDKPPVISRQRFSTPPPPRLVFLPEYQRIALYFDQQFVQNRAYRYDNKLVISMFIEWDLDSQYSSHISGEYLGSNKEWFNWNIDGWNPYEAPIALFHADNGYIDFRKGIRSGSYYMLSPFDNPPPEDIRVNSYSVDIPFPDLDYEVWRIVIDNSTDLSFLSIDKTLHTESSSLIEWRNGGNQLSGNISLDRVYLNQLPNISIVKSQLFGSNIVGLFINDGLGTNKIDVCEGQESISLELIPPIQGKIWVEPINRMRDFYGMDTLGELPFILLPECSISWPKYLYKSDDQPEIHFVSPDQSFSLKLEGAIPVDENRKEWKVNPNVSIVHGSLVYEEINVQIAHQVFRASIRKRAEKDSQYLLDSEFTESTSLVASGYPRESAVILLYDGEIVINLGQIGVFNDAGECRFTTFTIRDAIRKFLQPVGQFLIKNRNDTVNTSMLFINCDNLYKWIVEEKDGIKPSWWILIPGSLQNILSFLVDLKSNAIKIPPYISENSEIPNPLYDYYLLLVKCAEIFDDVDFPETDKNDHRRVLERIYKINSDIKQVFSWYNRANKFCSKEGIQSADNSESLLSQYAELQWIPPFERWNEKIRSIVSYLEAEKNVVPLLEEFSMDVKKGYIPKYSSRISKMRGGRELIEAWRRYRNDRFQGAVNTVKPLLSYSISPVSDIAFILLRICHLRQAYLKSQPALQYTSSNTKFSQAYEELMSIIDYGVNRDCEVIPKISQLIEITQVLPLSDNDLNLFNNFGKQFKYEDSNEKLDWLNCFFRLKVAIHGNDKQEIEYYAGHMENILKDIPASPDKQSIIRILENISCPKEQKS